MLKLPKLFRKKSKGTLSKSASASTSSLVEQDAEPSKEVISLLAGHSLSTASLAGPELHRQVKKNSSVQYHLPPIGSPPDERPPQQIPILQVTPELDGGEGSPSTLINHNLDPSGSTRNSPTNGAAPEEEQVLELDMPLTLDIESEREVRTFFTDGTRRTVQTYQIVFAITAITLLKEQSDNIDRDQIPPDQSWIDRLSPSDKRWINDIKGNKREQERILQYNQTLARKVLDVFLQEGVKYRNTLQEIVHLAPVLEKSAFHGLLNNLINKYDDVLTDNSLLPPIVQLVKCCPPEYLERKHLNSIVAIIQHQLENQHLQKVERLYEITQAIAEIVDVMTVYEAYGNKRVVERERLVELLKKIELKREDPFLLHQVKYAFQALLRLPDRETPTQELVRHAKDLVESGSKVAGAKEGSYDGILKVLSFARKLSVRVYYLGGGVVQNIASRRINGVETFDAIKKGFAAGERRNWYDMILTAKLCVRSGQMEALKKLVEVAPCRKDPEFQWGIAQLLEEVALDEEWKVTTRQRVADFLVELENDPDWAQDNNVKSLMLSIHHTLEKKADLTLSTLQSALSEDHLDGNSPLGFSLSYQITSRLPFPSSSPLLARVLNIPEDAEDMLQEYRRKVANRPPPIYVAPRVRHVVQEKDDTETASTTFELHDEVEAFLKGEKEVFLLIGDSGSGKSTYTAYLERCLWEKYVAEGPIPLLINLPSMKNPDYNLIHEYLTKDLDFPKNVAEHLEEYRNFILICDGYDERHLEVNLHADNKLNRRSQRFKLIVTCRASYLREDYRKWFEPQSELESFYVASGAHLFQQAVLTLLAQDQIKECVEQYVRHPETSSQLADDTTWTAAKYLDTLSKIRSLSHLISNPHHLYMALKILPGIMSDVGDESKIQVTLLALYSKFMDQLFEYANFKRDKMTPELLPVSKKMGDKSNFKRNAKETLKELAEAVFHENNGKHITVDIIPNNKPSARIMKLVDDPKVGFLVHVGLLKKEGGTIQFTHRAFLDYFYYLYIVEGIAEGDNSEAAVIRRLGGYLLTEKGQPKEFLIISFLGEYTREDSEFQSKLWVAINNSRSSHTRPLEAHETWASSNAMTILVKARESFNGQDLSHIDIRDSDLTGAQFDFVDFTSANMNGTSLSKAWFRNAIFDFTEMKDVKFAEKPWFQLGEGFKCCAYSKDGKFLALGYDQTGSRIDVYDIKLQTCFRSISVFKDLKFSSLAISGTDLLAAAGDKPVTWIWDLSNDSNMPIVLTSHANNVTCVAFSPNGIYLATASYDKKIVIWDLTDLKKVRIHRTLEGHTMGVISVAWFPKGRQLVSGSQDGSLYLWDKDTSKFSDHSPPNDNSGRELSRVVVSPNGKYIAVARLKDLLLFEFESNALRSLGSIDHSIVQSMAFSSDSELMASFSRDQSTRLWNTKTMDEVCEKLCGHLRGVYGGVFLGNKELTTCSRDKTVRFWDLSKERSAMENDDYGTGTDTKGHTATVTAVVYSSDGTHFLTSSLDGTVRKWDAITGDSEALSLNAEGRLESLAYCSDQGLVAVANQQEKITLCRLSAGGTDGQALIHRLTGSCVALSGCGRWMVSGAKSGAVELWDVRDRRMVYHKANQYRGGSLHHAEQVTSIAFSPSNKDFVTGSKDGNLLQFKTIAQSHADKMGYHKGGVSSVTFSKNTSEKYERLIITSGFEQSFVQVHKNVNGRFKYVPVDTPSNMVRCVACSPCGQWIACGLRKPIVQIYKRSENDWKCVDTLEMFLGDISCISWNPSQGSGQHEFVMGCSDHSVYVWTIGEINGLVSVKSKWWSGTRLVSVGAKISKAIGLSEEQVLILEQRGAIVEAPTVEITVDKSAAVKSAVVVAISTKGAPKGAMKSVVSEAAVAKSPVAKSVADESRRPILDNWSTDKLGTRPWDEEEVEG